MKLKQLDIQSFIQKEAIIYDCVQTFIKVKVIIELIQLLNQFLAHVRTVTHVHLVTYEASCPVDSFLFILIKNTLRIFFVLSGAFTRHAN